MSLATLNHRGTLSIAKSKSKEATNKVFGRDLEVLLTEQNQTIPFVVQDATKWLEKHSLRH